MPTTHATSLTNGEIVEENDLGSIRRVTAGGVTFQSLHECRDRQGGGYCTGRCPWSVSPLNSKPSPAATAARHRWVARQLQASPRWN